MCVGAGLHAGAAAEQYEPSSRYSINVIIARHESSLSSEAEAHARLFFVYPSSLSQRVSSTWFNNLSFPFFKKKKTLVILDWSHKYGYLFKICQLLNVFMLKKVSTHMQY